MSTKKTTKTYTITVTDDGVTSKMDRVNDGFPVFELLGMFEFIQTEIVQMLQNTMPMPDVVTRKAIVPE